MLWCWFSGRLCLCSQLPRAGRKMEEETCLCLHCLTLIQVLNCWRETVSVRVHSCTRVTNEFIQSTCKHRQSHLLNVLRNLLRVHHLCLLYEIEKWNTLSWYLSLWHTSFSCHVFPWISARRCVGNRKANSVNSNLMSCLKSVSDGKQTRTIRLRPAGY